MANIKRVRKAVIPAAGWGTRFLPATKSMPKEMLPIVDTPTIQYIVEEAVNSGIEQICLITSHTKRQSKTILTGLWSSKPCLKKAEKPST